MRYEFDEKGWSPAIRAVPSPHFNERPEGEKVSLVVVHGISLPAGSFGGEYVKALFTDCLDCSRKEFEDLKGLHVSSHFFIRRDGEIIQFVSCDKRAWHAGVSSFNGRTNCNDFSIGIELEGTDYVPYEEVQYQVLAELIDSLSQAYPIEAIRGHSDIAPGRKTDPGPYFDWKKLFSLLKESKLQDETLTI